MKFAPKKGGKKGREKIGEVEGGRRKEGGRNS
jgi:hypothetical protein